MSQSERFYRIDRLLQADGCVPLVRMLDELGVSRATFKRDIEYMRSRLHAPIEWDRNERGYKYVEQQDGRQQAALPGLWFNSSEAYALLMMQALLTDMTPGLLGAHIEPLKARLRAIIETGQHSADDVEGKVRLLNVATRSVPHRDFELVANALLRSVRLEIIYYGRGRDEASTREVSPQLLLFYRGNWYLVAWCHIKSGLRSFAVDAIERATVLDKAARTVSRRDLNGFVGQGYGIFSGSNIQWAKLRISAERARWVSREQWHPQQRSSWTADGQLILEVPFTDARELTMDILRHGHHLEVLKPAELRQAVQLELKLAMAQYLMPS